VLWNAYPLAVVNTAALKKSAITRDTPDPLPGTLDRDPKTGEPTGVLRSATGILKGLPSDPPVTPDQYRKALRRLLALYNEYGLTAIGDRGTSQRSIDVYRDMARTGELTVRVNCTRMTSAGPAERDPEVCKKKLAAVAGEKGQYGPTGAGDDWVRIGPLKVMLDGGMLSGTAYMREPWGVGRTYLITDPTYRGQLRSDVAGLRTLYLEAARRGWQLTAHTAGEGAMDELLGVYETVHKEVDLTRRRMLITHANFQSEENLRRCRALGVCADVQPAWYFLDGDSLLRTLGPRRMRWFLPLKSWLGATVIGGGSDHMIKLHPDTSINPWNPWLGIWVAVARKTVGGAVIDPEECLNREQAVRFYTINNAYLHFQEDKIGSLEKGKYADLIMVDRNILTCPVDDIRQTRVLLTMVGGKVVHDGLARRK
jgi:predicted amidohydrolase YtcJ